MARPNHPKKTLQKSKKDPVLVTVIIVVVALSLLVIGLGIRYIRSRHSPSDIKSIVLSHYTGTQVVDSQLSQTLTLTPSSCNLVIQTPNQGNYATTIQCEMNPEIWTAVTNAFFNNSFASAQSQPGTPAVGPLLLLGVYYTNGTSNTVYFAQPQSQNVKDFIQLLKGYAPANNQL